MPWMMCSVMDERVRFVDRLLDGDAMLTGTLTALSICGNRGRKPWQPPIPEKA